MTLAVLWARGDDSCNLPAFENVPETGHIAIYKGRSRSRECRERRKAEAESSNNIVAYARCQARSVARRESVKTTRNGAAKPLDVSGATITVRKLSFISSGETITHGRVLRISDPTARSRATQCKFPRASFVMHRLWNRRLLKLAHQPFVIFLIDR